MAICLIRGLCFNSQLHVRSWAVMLQQRVMYQRFNSQLRVRSWVEPLVSPLSF
ncbi:hypothetical protein F544_14400 [Bibersteinia trehalosi USDA-ARS-USMARC-190]|uniref:Uncharacterized protein n=1 Tax=Bibersteinia trehalosi USDA-ARS-USMARC-190 TaxID=1263832 RepID=W0RB98_BIBTR|nr:hypothetical protein F544_14400 [Bibersteinia trehalosi USDA-ARS-USMARC-190]